MIMRHISKLIGILSILGIFLYSGNFASAATMQVSRPWVQASGLVGYWSFNNLDVTDKVYDRSGNGNNGYVIGVASSSVKTTGRLGQGLKLDGASAEVDINDIPSFTGAADTPFTFGFWVRTSTSNTYEIISWNFNRRCRLVNTFVAYGIGCTVAGDEYAVTAAKSTSQVNDGQWHHIVYTHSAGVQKLYFDGVLEGNGTDTFTTGAYHVILGTREFAGGNFAGDIDEVRIYDRALSAAEAKALYRAGQVTVSKTLNTSVKSGLVGWWTFDGKDVLGTGPTSGNTGSIFPSTAGTLAGGTLSWANTGNILTSNDSRASVTLSGTAQSNYLRASNFGFAIPADATIVGIEGDIERRRSGGTLGQARDYSVRLVDDTGAFVGSDKADTGTNWPTAEDWKCVTGCYGGPTDKWGTALTPTQVNDPDFGMAIQVNGAAAGADRIAEVDTFDIVIYYITPGGVIDRSSSGNHGSINGVRSTAGKMGQGMLFDGSASLVNLGASAITNFANPMSTCAWVRSSSVADDQTIVVNSYNNDINNAFNFYIANSEINFTHALAGVYTGAAKTSGLTKNTWAHFCATWSGGTTKLYKDGIEMTALTGDPGYQDDENLIGSRVGIFDRVWNGTLDDVRIYSRALSSTEIKKIYNEGDGITIGKSQSNLIPSGLVGYWSFNGPDFTDRVYDRSGQGNHGYFNGGATTSGKTAGKLGQALKFDGINDIVDIPASASLNNQHTFTYAAWVYPTSNTCANDKGPIIEKSSGSSEEKTFFLQCTNTSGNGSIAGTVLTSGINAASYTPADTFLYNAWQHLVMTYDNAGDRKIHLYRNGVETAYDTQIAATGVVASDNTRNLGIGSVPDTQFYSYIGKIDDVRIYNRALSASEIKKLYNAGK